MAKRGGSAQEQLDFDSTQAAPAAKRVDRSARRVAQQEEADSAPRAFADGQRVRVSIRDVSRFSGNSGERMNGKAGSVERHCAVSFNGDPPLGPACLVRFEEPIPGSSDDRLPVEAFWFPPGDLEAL